MYKAFSEDQSLPLCDGTCNTYISVKMSVPAFLDLPPFGFPRALISISEGGEKVQKIKETHDI